MDYREHAPWPCLRPFVRGVWSLTAPGPAGQPDPGSPALEHLVPDGCPEIVLNRGAPYARLQADGSLRRQARVLLVGQLRSAITIAPSGTVDLIGIRFEPGGLHAVLGVEMHELTDQDLHLGDVDGRLHAALASAAERPGAIAPLEALQAVLARRLDERSTRAAGLVGTALERVAGGARTTQHLAASLGISRRALERLFRREVGLSPKRYMRIQRLQSVLGRLDTGPSGPDWAHLASAGGYADQSHMIRDFRLLVGTTPARYLAERTPLAGLFELGELSRSSNP